MSSVGSEVIGFISGYGLVSQTGQGDFGEILSDEFQRARNMLDRPKCRNSYVVIVV